MDIYIYIYGYIYICMYTIILYAFFLHDLHIFISQMKSWSSGVSRHVDHLGVLRMLHPWDLLLLLSLQQSAQDVRRLGDVSTKNGKCGKSMGKSWKYPGYIMISATIWDGLWFHPPSWSGFPIIGLIPSKVWMTTSLGKKPTFDHGRYGLVHGKILKCFRLRTDGENHGLAKTFSGFLDKPIPLQ